MYLQDTLSRFHRQGLHKIDFRVHVASASTCTFAFHKSQSCWAVRTQHNRPRWAFANFVPLVSRCDSFASSTKQRHQLGFTSIQTDHVLFLGGRTHGTTCSQQSFWPKLQFQNSCDGHHHDRTLRNARNPRNIKIATNDHVACRISNQISEQSLDVDFITSGSCADVSGQLTNCILDVRTIHEPRQISYTLKWRPMHNAVHWFDLRFAQKKGFKIWRNFKNAVICCGIPCQ